MGLGNMLGKEFGTWWRTRRWWMQGLIASGCVSTPLPQPATPLPTYTIQPIEPLPTAEIVVTPKGLSANSYQLVSQDSLFNYLTALTAI
jgi:hypothetical protein